ncbi:hypothetical protein P389DRAFT_30193 [Cystobasidium minutum MCA 4210]|uniref:uncharacterized protein n=1 Tax=Cystobasidium minutum MCA 4210 TaxID=1397322 RepID=UPI0034CDFDC6|eukprot:jgi/Rhomi1/30193/CE30192_55
MEEAPLNLPPTKLAEDNIYASSSNLTTLEAEVLGEYARLAKNLDKLTEVANTLAGMQPEIMAQLVPLERKLGLVVTLFRASVWATYMANEPQEDQ